MIKQVRILRMYVFRFKLHYDDLCMIYDDLCVMYYDQCMRYDDLYVIYDLI